MQRNVRRTLMAVAIASWVPMTFALCVPKDKRLEAFGYVVQLHAGGRLDVYHGDKRLVRWYDFAQGTPVDGVLGTAAGIGLGIAAARMGRSPHTASHDGGRHEAPTK